jgi:GntR family histidine utilization transcriptional repressor
MTVNKALRDLTAEGWLVRIQGKGTFVIEKKPHSSLLDVQPIEQVIRERGGVYSSVVHLLQEERVKPALAAAMGLDAYASVFHAVIVAKDNDVPIQLADRYISPQIAPELLEQDFTRETVSGYLTRIAPISAVEHIVEALLPDPWVAELLEINHSEPCLALYRTTWVGDIIATKSTIYHPGSRHTLGGKFIPGSSSAIIIS